LDRTTFRGGAKGEGGAKGVMWGDDVNALRSDAGWVRREIDGAAGR